MHLRPIALVAIILAALAAAPARSSAQDREGGGAFTVSPAPAKDRAVTEKGYFVYRLEPGGSARGSVLLRNTGGEPIAVELAAVDAETAQTGGSAFAPVDAEPAAVARWLSLPERSVTLRPREEKRVGFSLRVPESIEPGHHLAGIAAYVPSTRKGGAAERGEGQAGASVSVQTRYVIAVQVDVPGARTPSLAIPSVSLSEQPNGTYIGVELRNDGNVFLKPSGSLTLTDPGGKRVLSRPIEMGTFVTGTAVTYPVPWRGEPNPGKYAVGVELAYADGKVARYTGAIEIGAPAPDQAAQRAPAGEGVRPERAAEGVAPAARPAAEAPAAVGPWAIYGVAALLALVAVLLALNLLRGRRRGRSA